MIDRRRLLAAAKVLGFGAGLALLVVSGATAIARVRVSTIEWWPLVAALPAAVAWWLGLARVWSVLVSGRFTTPDAATWSRTQVLRYLPGGVWAPASRVVVAGGTAARRVAVVAAENLIALCGALTVAGGCLAAAGRWPWAALVLTALVPLALVRHGPRWAAIPGVPAATATAVAAFCAYVLCAVLTQAAISGLQDPAHVAGAAALAWAAGLVVVIAPGGLGVREAGYIALLAGQLPHGEAAAAAVITRVITIVAELVTFAVLARPRAGTGRMTAARPPATPPGSAEVP